MEVILSDSGFLLSYQFLIDQGISPNTIKGWITRNSAERIIENGKPYINYSSIPKQTLQKLPCKSDLIAIINNDKHSKEQKYASRILREAYEKEFIQYRDEYKKDNRLTDDQITKCAKLRAVWEKVLAFGNYTRINSHLFRAFDSIYPNKYKDCGVFCAVKSKARKNINSVVIDSRWFRNQETPFDDKIIFWTRALLSDPVTKTGKSIWRDLTKVCLAESLTPPSYSWVKKFVRQNEGNHEIHSSRFGKTGSFNQVEPYAKIIYDFAGSQWQLDGWELPFYSEGWHKHVLFVVRDAHSRKIVGYSVDKSENTTMILDGLQDAVRNTGFIPLEILSDNHSFNKTQEAQYFKHALESIGVTWNVDHNPRRKAITERHFRHLGELYCKEYPGYIGQGIKTKEKSGRPSQEYLDQFTKAGKWVTDAEIKAIAVKVVDDFNNSPLDQLKGKTPNEAHDQSDKPYKFEVDLETRLRLFTKQNKIKVTRGQINLQRAGTIYEYQLSADQFQELNGQKVTIRYEDFSCIYLFNDKDRCIGSVKQKVAIHGAIAEQTEKDIKLLQQNKGRLNGIKTKARKSNEALRDKIENISPDAFESLNQITTPKDVLKEIAKSYHQKQRLEDLGVNLELAERSQKPKNILPESFQPKQKDKVSPFTVKGKHTVSVIDLNKESEDY